MLTSLASTISRFSFSSDFRLNSLRFIFRCIGIPFLIGLATSLVQAGGGPENVLVVVNPLSPDSLTIANYYCQLRQIHSINVIHLPWNGSRATIDIETFRQSILQPIFSEIGKRRIGRQIDYIVYSSGFPYAIDFSSDLRSAPPKESGQVGSLTGLTYFARHVRSHSTPYIFTLDNPRSNYYQSAATRGFRSTYRWNQEGQRSVSGGEQYFLSVMLGYTDGRGNTVDEVIRYLRRSALADGTRPQGTVYLMQIDGEVRSETRHHAFPLVAAALREIGISAEVSAGVIPIDKPDVMGAVIGRSDLEWQTSRSCMLPGAICENLTSFGGILSAGASQTPLTEFLKYGAAGSSGTVVEPYALQAKFPHPWLHVHYSLGATMAEAFYQSIAAPYQLLIVGDPLCQPWARPLPVFVDELQPGQTVSGEVRLTPRVPPSNPVREFKLYIDGRYASSCRPGEEFSFDSLNLPDGYHEFRVVAIEDSALENQGRIILPVQVDNQGIEIRWSIQPASISPGQSSNLYVDSPGAKTIYVFYERRPLGRIDREKGRFRIDPRNTGQGPVRLTAVAVNRRSNQRVFAAPIHLDVRRTHDSGLQNTAFPQFNAHIDRQ